MTLPARINAWPRQMRAATAAAYVDETSVEAFRRATGKGKLYPSPKNIEGKGERWLREDLDAALDRAHGKTPIAPGDNPLKKALLGVG